MSGDLGAWRIGFAVMADSHVEPAPPGTAPPRSNLRTSAVVEAINRLRPAFTIHLGDLVHPVPGLPDREGALTAVRAILEPLEAPCHLLPGNHDIGDKPLPWMPAKTVSQAWVEEFERCFQPAFQSFSEGGCRFVLLDAPVLGSDLPAERAQQAWLEIELERHRGERLFVFSHYPPHLLGPDEPGHYDNLDPPARGWLLDLLGHHRVEALFAGHVHNLFHQRHGPTELYCAPSTAFVRRDYSELFRVGPAPEFGRDDEAKLGFLWVDLFERGHQVTFCRLGDRHGPVPLPPPAAGRCGVLLRHPWCEVVELPHNPPTDEFQRRKVPNDYPIWALLELGVRDLRVPLADLADRRTRRRMAWLAARGFFFTGFGVGVPDPTMRSLLEAAGRGAGRQGEPASSAPTLSTFEVILPLAEVLEAAPAIAGAKAASGLTTILAPLITSAETPEGGPNPRQFVGHGFTLEEREVIAGLFREPVVNTAFDGCVVRLDGSERPFEGIATAAGLADAIGVRISVTVGFAPPTPDGAQLDDQAIARRVAEAAFAALAHPEVTVLLDAFMDVDRGYYVRHGLIDRRCNPRAAGRIVRHLHRLAWPEGTPTTRARIALGDGTEALVMATPRGVRCLLFGDALPEQLELALPTRGATSAAVIDLIAGTQAVVVVAPGPGGRLRLHAPDRWPAIGLLMIDPPMTGPAS